MTKKNNKKKVPLKKKETAASFFKRMAHRYFIDALGSMAYGLFASLLIGTILKTIFDFIDVPVLLPYFQQIVYWTSASSPLVGASIGVAVAYGLKGKPLVIYSAAVVGGLAYMMNAVDVFSGDKTGLISAGPAGAIAAVIIASELGNLVYDKTPVNIIVVPAVSVISGTVTAVLIGAPISGFMMWLGDVVMETTTLYPLPMGIAVALLVGTSLTAPISSAALCMMLGLSGLAAGAATAGCCGQMIGFAVASFRENKLNGFLAQGLGTSKIQFPNVVKNPLTFLPALMASAVGGALSTTLFRMTNNPQGAGMGTCGLVGPIMTWNDMMAPVDDMPGLSGGSVLIRILILHFLIPGVIAFVCSMGMRKAGWIKDGDLKLIQA